MNRICKHTLLSLVIAFAHGALHAAELYVDQNSTSPEDPYSDWTSAAKTIQEAIGVASAGDTVYIAAGTYTADENSIEEYDAVNVVHSTIELSLIGVTNNGPVIIDGEGANRGVCLRKTGAILAPFVMRNLVISNCYAEGTKQRGGGAHLRGSTPLSFIIDNCTFVSNVVASTHSNTNALGGALSFGINTAGNASSHPAIITNSIFIGNIATNLHTASNYSGICITSRGGAVHANQYTPHVVTVSDCIFEDNWAGTAGAGIYKESYGNIVVNNSIFRRNKVPYEDSASSRGGAVHTANGVATIRNSLFEANVSTRRGGAAYGTSQQSSAATCLLENNTFVNHPNFAISERDWGGNKYPPFVLRNNIFYGNNDARDADLQSLTPESGKTHEFYNNFFESTKRLNFDYHAEDNVIAPDPMFVDYEGGDYQLKGRSPCVNSGMNQEWMLEGTDLAGMRRVNQGTVDMGCYENQTSAGSVLLLR